MAEILEKEKTQCYEKFMIFYIDALVKIVFTLAPKMQFFWFHHRELPCEKRLCVIFFFKKKNCMEEVGLV